MALERTLILIMMKKADFKADRLQWLSRVYGAEALARAYLEYLKTMGRIRQPGFPDWREFSRRMGEYA